MIRKAELYDLDSIISLFTLNSDVYSEHEINAAKGSINKMIKERRDKEEYYVLSSPSNKIIGCAGLSEENDTDGVYTLCWLAVHPNSQRRGIGTRIYNYIEERVKALGGRLIIINAGSGEDNQHFYKKRGFKQAGMIPKYYNKSKDLIWYYKELLKKS